MRPLFSVYLSTHSFIYSLFCCLNHAAAWFGHWKLLQIDSMSSMSFYISSLDESMFFPPSHTFSPVLYWSLWIRFYILVASQDYMWNWYCLKNNVVQKRKDIKSQINSHIFKSMIKGLHSHLSLMFGIDIKGNYKSSSNVLTSQLELTFYHNFVSQCLCVTLLIYLFILKGNQNTSVEHW